MGLLRHIHDESSNKICLVLEDDVILQPQWQEICEQQVRDAPEDWDMLLAGWWNAAREIDRRKRCYEARGPTCQTWQGRRLYFYAGQHGYLVRSGPQLLKLLRVLEGQQIRHIDEMRCWGQGQLRTYALADRFVWEDSCTARVSTRVHGEDVHQPVCIADSFTLD